MAKKKPTINLLRHQEKSSIDKFLDWAFTVGRGIVIITESIALFAFAYRFILDRQIIDLKDKIKQEQTIVRLSKPNEEKFRSLQNQLSEAKTLDEQSTSKTELLAQVVKLAQGKMSFHSLNIDDKAVTMDGIIPSAASISSFAQDLRGISGVAKVNIGQITNNTATGVLTAGITANLVQPVVAPVGIGTTQPAATSVKP